MRRLLLTLVAIAIIAGLGFVGFTYQGRIWHWLTKTQSKSLAEADRLIAEGKPQLALYELQPYDYEATRDNPEGTKWREAYLKAAIAAKDNIRILWLYEHSPTSLDDNEEAALLAADALIKLRQAAIYEQLRNRWKGKETKKNLWFVLDADKLLLEGRRNEADALLKSQAFEGKDDSGRLLRLALLGVRDDPRQAWQYLAEAYAKDPDNPEVRSYRARLLEAVDRQALAEVEYLAAALTAPKNVYYKDQLAEFYRRNNRYDLALTVWKEALKQPESDQIWLKTWFWSHVVTRMNFKWAEIPIPDGPTKPFLQYLGQLKPGTYWDQVSFDKLPDAQNYLKTQQATFWLRLLDALQKKREDQAWEILQYSSFGEQSWNPNLETLLKKVLTYRKIGSFSIDIPVTPAAEPAQSSRYKLLHPYFTEVEQLSKKGADKSKMPPGLQALLQSDLAIPTCFLAVGWLEAALNLGNPSFIPADLPDWVTYGYTQAIRENRGIDQALAFATNQTPSPALRLLIGEMLIASGNSDAGIEQLKPLARLDTDVGYRAAWILSLVYIDKKELDKARETVNAQPRLASAVLGKQTLARIAVIDGKTDLADKLYAEIENSSAEAQSYLARKAFLDKNWKRARELTEALLRQYPTNAVLRENLKRIDENDRDQTPNQ